MTIVELQNSLREKVREAAAEKFGIDLDQIASEIPPKTELGDLAFPVAFELAKLIKGATGEKQNPRAIAEELKAALERSDFVDRVEIAGPGYLNVFYDRALFLAQNADAPPLPMADAAEDESAPKVCVEHTSVNPNKAAHIGHVRNAVIGDTFQRILQATGKRVEVQYYIDNTGVQVADVAIGFIYLENMDLDAIKLLSSRLVDENKAFDYYCWDLYARVGQEYQRNEELKDKRAEILHAIEAGNNDIAEIAEYIATRNVECIVNTMERFNVRYDLLPRESDILHLHFWDTAFEQMKQLGVIHFENEGKNKGCWVMPFEEHSGTDDHESDKILVRSNGTITYTGKDIAYQMWKLGILGLDFYYRPFHEYSDGRVVWTTTEKSAEAAAETPVFGQSDTIYNVIDTRQSYPQRIVRMGVAAIDPGKGEEASVHLSYEMVALSPAAAEELGFQLNDEDRKRPFIEMSGRKGLGVKADDLLDRLEENALVEVESRHPETDAVEKHIAHQIAVGALRYFLLKFTRTTVIVFDFKEALSFDGETGCFCQYSAVRANSIFRKLTERGESIDQIRPALNDAAKVGEVFASERGDDIWSMLVHAARLEDTLLQAANATEPAILAKYTFNLAKAFNLFYHHHKILPEPDPVARAVLISVADIVRNALTAALNTMGIEVPEKM